MNCSHARTTLYPTPEQALLTIETPRATDHLRQCNDCQEFFKQQRQLSGMLREKAGAGAAPDAVRERVERLAGRLPKTRLWIRAAACAVFASGLGAIWFLFWPPSPGLFQEMFLDHAKYLDAQSQLTSGDPAEIESWFRGKAEFRVQVPILDKSDLLGGRLCFLKNRKAAVIFYRRGGRPISLFKMSASDVNLWPLERTVIDGIPVWRMSFNGYSLQAVENRGVVSILVSDLAEGELLPLALAARRG
jgi:hypothetical protein